jgi:hypothetical protein
MSVGKLGWQKSSKLHRLFAFAAVGSMCQLLQVVIVQAMDCGNAAKHG